MAIAAVSSPRYQPGRSLGPRYPYARVPVGPRGAAWILRRRLRLWSGGSGCGPGRFFRERWEFNGKRMGFHTWIKEYIYILKISTLFFQWDFYGCGGLMDEDFGVFLLKRDKTRPKCRRHLISLQFWVEILFLKQLYIVYIVDVMTTDWLEKKHV